MSRFTSLIPRRDMTTATTVLLLLAALLSFNAVSLPATAAERANITPTTNRQVEPDKGSVPQGTKEHEEILIAGDTEEGLVLAPQWCGSTAVVYSFSSDAYMPDPIPPSYGDYWVNLITGKHIKLQLGDGASRAGCSSDGKWVIYSDDSAGGKASWRYQVETGQKQKFRVGPIGIAGWQPFSPDGQKYLLARKPFDFVEMPEPRWEIVWLHRKYQGFGEKIWMADSASVLIHDRNLRGSIDQLGVERLSDGQFKKLNTDLKISNLRVDKENRIYGLVDGATPSSGKPNQTRQLVRCQISNDTLRCKALLPASPRKTSYSSGIEPEYFITPDSKDIIFREDGSNCIWRFRIEKLQKECVLRVNTGNVFKLSPDGKWLLFDTPTVYGKSELKVVQLPQN